MNVQTTVTDDTQFLLKSKGEDMIVCERCHKDTSGITIMSMFNTQKICKECKDKEEKHPMYPIARDREYDACLSGDFNYIGMGLPPDLK